MVRTRSAARVRFALDEKTAESNDEDSDASSGCASMLSDESIEATSSSSSEDDCVHSSATAQLLRIGRGRVGDIEQVKIEEYAGLCREEFARVCCHTTKTHSKQKASASAGQTVSEHHSVCVAGCGVVVIAVITVFIIFGF